MSTSQQSQPPANRPHSLLPQWMRQSFEHLGMRKNLEEFGSSPPENENLFLHDGNFNNYVSNTPTQPLNSDSVSSAKTSSLVFKAKDLAPRGPRNLSVAADQVCPNSAPQSAATTPSVSPQQSPTLIRKILSADSHCKPSVGSKLTDSARKVLVVPVTRVTNFDLNAVSPTSW